MGILSNLGKTVSDAVKKVTTTAKKNANKSATKVKETVKKKKEDQDLLNRLVKSYDKTYKNGTLVSLKKNTYGNELDLVNKYKKGDANDKEIRDYKIYQKLRQMYLPDFKDLDKNLKSYYERYKTLSNGYHSQEEYDKYIADGKDFKNKLETYWDYYTLYDEEGLKQFERYYDNYNKTISNVKKLKSTMSNFKNEDEFNGAIYASGIKTYKDLTDGWIKLEKSYNSASNESDKDDILKKMNWLNTYGFNQNVINSMTDEDWENERIRSNYAYNFMLNDKYNYMGLNFPALNNGFTGDKNEVKLDPNSKFDWYKNENQKLNFEDYINPFPESKKPNVNPLKLEEKDKYINEAKKHRDSFYPTDIDSDVALYYTKISSYKLKDDFDDKSKSDKKLLNKINSNRDTGKISDFERKYWAVNAKDASKLYGESANLTDYEKLMDKLGRDVQGEPTSNYNKKNVDINVHGKGGLPVALTATDSQTYSFMTEDEIKTFNYIYNTKGEKEAEKYLDTIQKDQLNPKYLNYRANEAYKFGKEHPWLSLAFNGLEKPGDAIASIWDNVANVMTGDEDNIDPYSLDNISYYTHGARIQGGADSFNSGFAKGAYKVGNTAAEQLGTILGSGGNGVLNGLLNASSTMEATTIDYKLKGASDGEAVGMGIINGLIEYGLEKVSWDNIVKTPDILTRAGTMKKLGAWGTKFAKDFGIEGGTEVLTNWATSLAAFLTDNREHDEFLSTYDELRKNGLSGSDAFFDTVKKMAPGYLEEFVAVGLTGGAFGSVNTYGNVKTASIIREDAGDYFSETDLTVENVQRLLIMEGLTDEAEIANVSNGIVEMGQGQKVDSAIEAKIKENPVYRGILHGYVDVYDIAQEVMTDSKDVDVSSTAPTGSTATSAKTSSAIPSVDKDLSGKALNMLSESNPDFATTREGRAGREVYLSEVTEGEGGLVDSLIKDGFSKEDALTVANQMYDFMYEQGYKGKDMDVAINAVSENIMPGYEKTAELFYTAGKIDAQNVMRGKKSAKVIHNDVLKDMYKTGEISHKTVRAINAFSAKAGFDIEFVEEIEGGHNASFNTKTGVLQISRDSKKPFISAAIHETVHAIRSVDTESYNKLRSIVYEVLSQNRDAYKGVWSEMYSLYKNEATDTDGRVNKDYISEEMTAEVVSQLLTDEAFVNEMAKTDRNFVQRIYDAIVDFFDKMMSRYTDAEKVGSADMDAAVKQLQSEFDNIKKMYKKALANTEVKRGVNMTLPKNLEKENSILYSFNDNINSESKFIIEKINENLHLISPDNKFSVISDKIAGDEQKSKYIFNIFKSQGGMAYNSVVGNVELTNAGAKSTVFHGFGDTKLAAAKAIKDVIENGDIVHVTKNHNNSGTDRFIIAAKGKIDSEDSFVGVIIKSYPNNQKFNSKFYLHEALIIEKDSPFMTAPQLSVDAMSESFSNNSIDNPDPNVNTKFTNTDNNELHSKSSAVDTTQDIEPPMEQTAAERSAASFELKAEVRRKLNEHIEKYGTLEKGVNPVRDVDLPKKTADDRYVRRGTRTVIESARVTDEVAQRLTEEIANGEFWTTYERAGDKKAQETAQKRLEHEGFDKLLSEWDSIVESDKKIDKQDMVNAQLLMEEAAKNGDTETVVKIVTDIAAEATRAGQIVQSMMLLKKLGAGANVYKIEQTVKKLQKDLDKKFGNKSPTLELPKDLMEEYARVFESEDKEGNNDHSASDAIVDKIYEEIAKQIPSKWVDRLNAWRYFAMLGNPRTHIRNMVGNLAFMPAIFAKNLISATGEGTTAAVLKMFGRQMQRTKTVKGVIKGTFKQGSYKYALNDASKIESILKGEEKYSVGDKIMQKVDVFKRAFMNKLVNKNSDLLEKEDWIFLRRHYARALTMYMDANKLDGDTITDKQLEKARMYAIKEAQKATFRDASKLAATLSNISKQNKTLGFAVEAILPFKKTPINILKRGVEYSPVGIVGTIYKGIRDVKKGKFTASEFIDGLGANLTGTALLAVGVYLASEGILRGPGDDEEDNKFSALLGMQNYSLKIGDGTYTIDWLSPSAMSMFVGCEFWNAMDDGKLTFADIGDALPKITEPLFDMSMLDGLANLVETASYSQSSPEALASILFSIPTNYAGQFVPTLLGQVARTVDPVRRKTYIDKNSKVPQWLQSFAQQQAKKIPFLSKKLQPYVNAKGEEELNAEGNVFARAMQNFLSPGYYKSIKSSAVDEEIMRLYESEGENAKNIIPKNMQKYITVDGERVNLSAEQYTTYQKTAGQMYYRKLKEVISSDYYKGLSDSDKVKLLEDVREYSIEYAKEKTLPEYHSDSSKLKTFMELDGGYQFVLSEKTDIQDEIDIVGNRYSEYEKAKTSTAKNIMSQFDIDISNTEFNSRYRDKVYEYAKEVNLEKYSDGKYKSDKEWIQIAMSLNDKERAEFIYGKTLTGQFDTIDDARETIYNDEKISGMVKMYVLSTSAAEKYSEYLNNYNVDPVTWLKVREAYDNTTTIEQNGEKVTKKQQVIAMIDELDVSDVQKSAIYRALGYKDTRSDGKSNIEDVSWNYSFADSSFGTTSDSVTTSGSKAVKTYSVKANGDTKLSADFSVREFACKDGSDSVLISPELVNLLQKIRDHFGKSMTINSGYRNAPYNKKVGGASDSQHTYGTAADIVVHGVAPEEVARYAEQLMPNSGGVGRYSTFTHVDVRSSKARWMNY